jgi:glucose/arabinose dehydrogenase
MGINKLIYSTRILLFLLISIASAIAQTPLVPQKISLRDGREFSLNLPANYEIIPAAEGLNRVRFFAVAPDGRIFVTDMLDMSDNRKGTVYILDSWNARKGKFGKVTPFMTNLRNPNSIAFHTDKNGQDWFYLAETDQLTRRKYVKNSTEPTTDKPEILATFPGYGLGYKHGSWHLTRTIAFSPSDKLYVSVGTSCDLCEEKKSEKDIRGVVLEMNPDGTERKVYARNIKNAVGLKWIGKRFFASNEGVDHLGSDKPDDTLFQLKEGADYGWSKCFQADGKIEVDPKYIKKNKPLPDCSFVPTAWAYFPAHSSALGFDFFDTKSTDKMLKNSFLVALHGSTDRNQGRGYKIVTVREGNEQQDFVTGFVQGINTFGRPCDVLKMSPNSFLFSDDRGGVVYYVRRKSR